VNLEDIKQKVE